MAQSAHAFAAFQIAEHWGNRFTPRPAPRADVLAAVLLHDSGWDDHEGPRVDGSGRPLAFDTIGYEEHETIWAASVERAGVYGRYARYLVSHHVAALAASDSSADHTAFLAAQRALHERLRLELEADPRYRAALAARTDEVNRAVVSLADAIAVHLGLGVERDAVLEGLPRRAGSAPLALRRIGERTYRLHPWPLVGRRLDVTSEGRLLPAREFADEAAARAAWGQAPTVRLTWTLLAAGEAAD